MTCLGEICITACYIVCNASVFYSVSDTFLIFEFLSLFVSFLSIDVSYAESSHFDHFLFVLVQAAKLIANLSIMGSGIAILVLT